MLRQLVRHPDEKRIAHFQRDVYHTDPMVSIKQLVPPARLITLAGDPGSEGSTSSRNATPSTLRRDGALPKGTPTTPLI